MKINKIVIDKFKSFYDPFELDFNSVKGIWKISGSVGAGKTTIGEAILFALFGTISGKNNGDLVSWGYKMAHLEIWCNSNGKNIYIKRDIANTGWSNIYVEIDGEELIFTNKRNAQKQLEEDYYDVSRVTMELLCIISFNNFKSLANLNTYETKTFLDQVLGFHVLSEYSDIAKRLKKDNEQKMTSISNSISNIDAQIRKLEEISNMEIIEGNVADCEMEIKEIDAELSRLKKDHDKERDSISHSISNLKAELAKIKTLGSSKLKEIQFIEKGICPTCGAPIDQSQLKVKKDEREVLLKQYKDISEKIAQSESQMTSETLSYESNIKPLSDKRSKLRDLLITLKAQNNRVNVNKDQIELLNNEKMGYEKELNECTTHSVSWERLYNILSDDVRATILESFIPALNANIMKYSTELHQPYIIKFDRQFKCSVSLVGYENDISISSLSTGQMKTVDMMIILGVLCTVLGSASTNVIFLDELFSNLDGTLRNDMCSVLHNFISEDDTMFVISHQELDERYFNGTIKMKLESKGQYEKHSTASIIQN